MKISKHPGKQKEPNKILRTAALQFISDINPSRFSRNLRKLLLDYISQNKDCLPVDFNVMLNDLNNLFELLDKIDNVQQK